MCACVRACVMLARLAGSRAGLWGRCTAVCAVSTRPLAAVAAAAGVRPLILASGGVRVATHRALSTQGADPPVEDTDKLRQSMLALQKQQEQLLALSAKLASMDEVAEQRQKAAEREAELNAAAVAKLLGRLGEVRDHVSYTKYLELCGDFGVEDTADDLLRKLQESGQILRCEGTAFADLVLLNPRSLAQRLAIAAERPPGTSPAAARQLHAAASVRLDRLIKQLSELDKRKQDLDGRASWKVSRNMTLGLGVWSMQVAVYYHLVYAPGALSWDVMEPVAYFTLEAATIGWWLYVPLCTLHLAAVAHHRAECSKCRRPHPQDFPV